MKRLALVAVTAMMLIGAAPAAAHFGPFVAPHVHQLTTPGTVTTVGPDGCATGGVGAFQNFHYNFHVGEPGAAFATNPVAIRGIACP